VIDADIVFRNNYDSPGTTLDGKCALITLVRKIVGECGVALF
jgi:hypothetical protein